VLNHLIAAIGHHPRRLTVAAVLLMASVGWLWLIAAVLPGGISDAMMAAMDDSAGNLALTFAMWVAMVLAMMLPTAAPTFRAYADRAGAGTAALVGGYTTVWLVVAGVATAGQVG
jgi:Predicted metal-binding integral membrane protein (DUF2182).